MLGSRQEAMAAWQHEHLSEDSNETKVLWARWWPQSIARLEGSSEVSLLSSVLHKKPAKGFYCLYLDILVKRNS